MTEEICVGCKVVLPAITGATHRYMESSPSCWAAFNQLSDPNFQLEPSGYNTLIVDTYAAQHPGVPSNQTINSVAIHLMVLHGIFEHQFQPSQALWLRMRPGRPSKIPKHNRFFWLEPPSFDASLTVSDVIAGTTSKERTRLVQAWSREVWDHWSMHHSQVATWFEKYVFSERF
ncbi:MAG: hypothetical protein RLZZ156_1054 [Deinococcota bacterium]|jgi:hypothetical protein